MNQVTKRLSPGEDLKEELEKLILAKEIQAGVVLSLVGGLSQAALRLAGGKKDKVLKGDLEIVGATGTVAVTGSHIHLAVADAEGKVTGGHLHPGCIVRTTVEIVLLHFTEVKYHRERDEKTGYDELIVE